MNGAVPLCVELEGALAPVDTLMETLLARAKQTPGVLWGSWKRGNAQRALWRSELAERSGYDARLLPLRRDVVDWLEAQRAAGRSLVLTTRADQRIAADFAQHTGLFDEVIASQASGQLDGAAKRAALIARFGERGFDYLGAEAPSDSIWGAARQAVVVGDERSGAEVARQTQLEQRFDARTPGLKTWLKAIRLHQWVKNGLIFVPALLAHAILLPGTLRSGLLAFIAFGLCASSVYLLNDLFDLASDRQHPRKRHRPFAAGSIPARQGLFAAIGLLLAAALITVTLNWRFAAVLAGYYVLTWAYSVRLKRVALIDVMILAALYTIRIIAGAAATSIALSFWLLAFSVFMFMSLGFVKRFSELESARRAAKAGGAGRGYGADDLPLLMSLGTSSGYCAIVVMALYINSGDSTALYHHHKPLWLICPLMLFWISRVWTLTARGHMHDDPVVFALRDRTSLGVLGALVLIVALSI